MEDPPGSKPNTTQTRATRRPAFCRGWRETGGKKKKIKKQVRAARSPKPFGRGVVLFDTAGDLWCWRSVYRGQGSSFSKSACQAFCLSKEGFSSIRNKEIWRCRRRENTLNTSAFSPRKLPPYVYLSLDPVGGGMWFPGVKVFGCIFGKAPWEPLRAEQAAVAGTQRWHTVFYLCSTFGTHRD